MSMIAAFAALMMPADPEAILMAVIDRYSQVKSAEGVAVHRGQTEVGGSLTPEEAAKERTYKFTWSGPKNFEVRPGKNTDPFAAFYRGDGRDVYAIYPDQRRIKLDSTPRPGVVPRWEAMGGLVFSLISQAPVLKQLTETPRNYDRNLAWGERKELKGQSVRELVIDLSPRKMDIGGGEEQEGVEPPPPYRVSLYLHDYRPELIGYSYAGNPDTSLVYYSELKVRP